MHLFGIGAFQFFAGGWQHPPVEPLPVGVSPTGKLCRSEKLKYALLELPF